jgi:hypothetical protein
MNNSTVFTLNTKQKRNSILFHFKILQDCRLNVLDDCTAAESKCGSLEPATARSVQKYFHYEEILQLWEES